MAFINSISTNMDSREISSFLTSRFMGNKDICILVVHDDPMYRDIIFEMLQNCSHYEVVSFKRTADALNIVEEKKDRLSLVLTDVHRSHPNAFEILNYIDKEFKLAVVSMSPHQNARVVHVGLDSSAKLYFVKSLSVNEFKILWHHAYIKERGKSTSFEEREIGTSLESDLPIRDVSQEDENNKKRKSEEMNVQSEGDKDDSTSEKKQRVIWNQSMHKKFLEAVRLLGHDRAFPKKILEIMDVPGLTRENVASHLQKYRMCLKRARQDKQSIDSIFRTPLQSFQASHSDFISSGTNHLKYYTQNNLQCHTQSNLQYNTQSNLQYNTQNHLQYQTQNPIFSSYQSRPSLIKNSNFSNLGQNYFFGTSNQESLRTPYAYSSSLFSKTQNNTYPINTTMPFSKFYSNYPETSTDTPNFGQKNPITFNNQDSPITPNTQNSPLFDTTKIQTSPSANENPQPNFLNNNRYVGFRLTADSESVECGQTSAQNISNSMTDTENFLSEDNINEILAQFPSMEMDKDSEPLFYMPEAEFEIEDLLDNGVITPSPNNITDLDHSLLDHT